MDVRTSMDDAVAQATKEYSAGNYRGVVELLLPFTRPKQREKLSPQQELDVVMTLTGCYRCLLDFKAALPYAERHVVLEQQLHGPRSLERALALKGLCMVHQGLEAFPAARKAIAEALAIMDELGLQQHEQYGGLLMVLGGLELGQRRYKEALIIYDKAKAVLVQYKEKNRDYGALLTWPLATRGSISGTRLLRATRNQSSTSATCSAPTILSTQPHCTTSRCCSPSSSSTKKPSHDLRRRLSSTTRPRLCWSSTRRRSVWSAHVLHGQMP